MPGTDKRLEKGCLLSLSAKVTLCLFDIFLRTFKIEFFLDSKGISRMTEMQ